MGELGRICTVCGEWKFIREYPKNGKDKQGNVRYRTDCRECYNITRKLTKRKAVTKFLNNTAFRTGERNTYDLHDWKDAMLHFRGCCAYCGTKQTRKLKLTRDHFWPVSDPQGRGLTTRVNIVPACSSCNSSKSDKDFFVWYPKYKHYSPEREKLILEWVKQ